MNDDKEVWKNVIGFEGKYEVSSHGRVRRTKTGVILKTRPAQGGYYGGVIYNFEGKGITFRTHKLVAAAFLGPCPAGKEVNHKRTDKTNNRYDNLEYKTHKQNQQHAAALGLLGTSHLGSSNGRSKLTETDVVEIRSIPGIRHRTKAKLGKIAMVYGVSKGSIWNIVHRVSWKHV
jgi:hypothetical protein